MNADQIKTFAPGAKSELVKAVVDGWSQAEAAGITTPERIAHFMAQIATETGGLAAVEENLNYTAERMMVIWPKKFKTKEAAEPYANNPEGLANHVYGGILGNNQDGDGWTYRGGGMLQTTGRANYTKLGFGNNPADLRVPATAFSTAVREWSNRNCNLPADADRLNIVRAKINGGITGINVSASYLKKAMEIWAMIGPPEAPAEPAGTWRVRVGKFLWHYTFTAAGRVTWLDPFNKQSGGGAWRSVGAHLSITWDNSKTVEVWDLPLKSAGQTGRCKMDGEPETALSAERMQG